MTIKTSFYPKLVAALENQKRYDDKSSDDATARKSNLFRKLGTLAGAIYDDELTLSKTGFSQPDQIRVYTFNHDSKFSIQPAEVLTSPPGTKSGKDETVSVPFKIEIPRLKDPEFLSVKTTWLVGYDIETQSYDDAGYDWVEDKFVLKTPSECVSHQWYFNFQGIRFGLIFLTTLRIAKCNAHTAIAAGIIQSGKSFIKYLNDEIDEEQMLEEVSHTVITGTSAFYYGALGQVAIPIPVVGAIIGSTVGYFVGNILYQSGLVSLGDTVGVKMAKERRKRIEAICLQAIPLMQKHREELQILIDQHLAEQSELFDTAFSFMDTAITEWNPDAYIFQLERICNTFNTGLPFKSFKEFDEFMLDENTTFEL